MKWEKAFELAVKLKVALADGCERLEIVGSVKRHDKEEVHDIEILCVPNNKAPRAVFGQPKVHKNMLEKTLADMQYNELITSPVKNGEKYKKFQILGKGEINQFFLDLFIVRHETWAIQNVIRTGPAEFSHRFVTNKNQGGLLPNDYRYVAGETRIEVKISAVQGFIPLVLMEEEDAIALLNLGWIEPGKRRDYIKPMTGVT